MAHYISGRSGDSYLDKTIHGDPDCRHLRGAAGGVRPVGTASVEVHAADLSFCGSCTDRDDGDD